MMKIFGYTLLVSLMFAACSEDYLDQKPAKSIVIPSTLADLQALLDNTRVMNYAPAIGLVGTDDIMMDEAGWEGLLNALERNGYIWAKDVYQGQQSCPDWAMPYEQVFYANVVLEELAGIDPASEERTEWNHIRGRALFYRALAFYELAQLFCLPYHADNFDRPGIPLRLTADVNAPIMRSTVKQTYDRIIDDLEEAVGLLPEHPEVKTRPAQAAGHALLARVFLSMEDYVAAEQNATKALALDATLLDYNDVRVSASRPFTTMHDEIVFHSSLISYRFLNSALTYIDTVLIKHYDADDLRKLVFFTDRGNGRYTFKGSYTGNLLKFGGISNNEVYITRAECRARNGNIPGALADLNALLERRWRSGAFVPVAETDPEELLAIILEERRKELVFRNIRWTDLRRLNQDPRYRKTLTRELDGVAYTLPPKDPRYVYPIPFQEVSLSGIAQNER